MNGATTRQPASTSSGATLRQPYAVSGKPCRHKRDRRRPPAPRSGRAAARRGSRRRSSPARSSPPPKRGRTWRSASGPSTLSSVDPHAGRGVGGCIGADDHGLVDEQQNHRMVGVRPTPRPPPERWPPRRSASPWPRESPRRSISDVYGSRNSPVSRSRGVVQLLSRRCRVCRTAARSCCPWRPAPTRCGRSRLRGPPIVLKLQETRGRRPAAARGRAAPR